MTKTRQSKAKEKSEKGEETVSKPLGNLERSEIYRKIGQAVGFFQHNVEAGWKNPDTVFPKGAIKVKGKPFSLIASSVARRTSDKLRNGCKTTNRLLGKGYRAGRAAILIKMWRIEHPGATKTEEEMAIKKIEGLFKTK